jgi:inner membrane protein
MMTRTHLAIGLFSSLFLLDHVSHQFAFVVVTLISSILPDVDSNFSTLGRRIIFRPIQFFSKHRGFFHSFTFCFLITVVLTLYLPIYSLPFFLGYALHLFADSFTVEGIQSFWPLSARSKGVIRVGGHIETVIFTFFCVGSAFLLLIGLF